MEENNWVKWGEDVKKTVQTSIDQKDFSKLSSDIERIISSAVKNVGDNLRSVNGRMADAYHQKVQEQTKRVALYGSSAKITVIGLFLAVLGYGGAAAAVVSMLAASLTALLKGTLLWTGGKIVLAFALLFFAGALAAAIKGTRMFLYAGRFQKYVKALGNKEACSVASLAKTAGKSDRYVEKDLKAMIEDKLFLQGHLEVQEHYFITSDAYYRQYQQAKKQFLIQEEEKKKAAMMQSALPEHVRQILEEGELFIKKIHASNDAIPGELISAKIEYMEHIVRKIFDRVKQKPELADDMKRMMSYYLPTTIKLLEAYEELDAQPVQGPNIKNSKQEIEKTMDTLNTAFENLLDSFYQETAWDISSDISVLETMLAQEGLTESDFKQKK